MMHAKREQDFTHHIWIGLDDINVEGKWVYNDGTELKNWSKWGVDQPRNQDPDGEDCVVINFRDSLWHDVPCTKDFGWHRATFVCQNNRKGMLLRELYR